MSRSTWAPGTPRLGFSCVPLPPSLPLALRGLARACPSIPVSWATRCLTPSVRCPSVRPPSLSMTHPHLSCSGKPPWGLSAAAECGSRVRGDPQPIKAGPGPLPRPCAPAPPPACQPGPCLGLPEMMPLSSRTPPPARFLSCISSNWRPVGPRPPGTHPPARQRGQPALGVSLPCATLSQTWWGGVPLIVGKSLGLQVWVGSPGLAGCEVMH